MKLADVLASVPWFAVLSWIAAHGLPYLTSLVARNRNRWTTGALTFVTSEVTSFVAVMAGHPWTMTYVRVALVNGFVVWIIATKHDDKWLKGTKVDGWLLSLFSGAKAAVPVQQPGAVQAVGSVDIRSDVRAAGRIVAGGGSGGSVWASYPDKGFGAAGGVVPSTR